MSDFSPFEAREYKKIDNTTDYDLNCEIDQIQMTISKARQDWHELMKRTSTTDKADKQGIDEI